VIRVLETDQKEIKEQFVFVHQLSTETFRLCKNMSIFDKILEVSPEDL